MRLIGSITFCNGVYATRVLMGLSIFCYYLSLLPEYNLLFGNYGIYTFYESTIESPIGFKISFISCLLLSFLVTVGLVTRLSLLALFFIHPYFSESVFFLDYGWRSSIPLFFIYLIFMDSGAKLSFDAYIRNKPPNESLRNIFFFIFKLHLALIYLGPALLRLDRPLWIEGNAMFVMLNTFIWGRTPPFYFNDYMALQTFFNYFFWIAEFAAPILLFSKYCRQFAYLMIIMHLGIFVFLDVGMWSPIMISLLLGLFKLPKSISH